MPDPTGAAPILGADGAGIIGARAGLIPVIALAVEEGDEPGLILKIACRDQLFGAARRDRIARHLGAIGGGNPGGRGAECRCRRVGLPVDGGHEFRVFRGQLRQFLRPAHHALQRGVVKLVDGRDADPFAKGDLHRQIDIVGNAGGRHIVAGKAHIAAGRTGQLRGAFVRLGKAHDLGQDRLGLCFGKDAHIFLSLTDQPSERAVLMTLMPLKRAVLEPCDTAETCAGWPLPSKKEPPRR